MKYAIIIGLLLVIIAAVSTYVSKINFNDLMSEPEFPLGLLYGGGFGLIVGSFLGWLFKKPYAQFDKPSNKENANESK